MAKRKFEIWGFHYLADKNGINILTGTKEESDREARFKCFDGVACLRVGVKCYMIEYPKMRCLTNEDKETICDYCGYYPQAGEYGIVCGALGKVHRCTEGEFNKVYNL